VVCVCVSVLVRRQYEYDRWDVWICEWIAGSKVQYSTACPGSGTEPDRPCFLLPREGWLKAYDYDYGYDDDNHKDEGTSTYVRITYIASPITRSPGAFEPRSPLRTP